MPDLAAQYVDVGAEDGEEAGELVDVGDPVTVSTTVRDLHGSRLAARGAGQPDRDLGRRRGPASRGGGRRGRDGVRRLDGPGGGRQAGRADGRVRPRRPRGRGRRRHPATAHPSLDAKQRGPVELGAGPAITRGSVNHPELVELARAAAGDAGVDVQLEAAGGPTGTDADEFHVARGGIPSLTVGVPNRYMHTPVEVIDCGDLDDAATLLCAMTERAATRDGFAVDL